MAPVWKAGTNKTTVNNNTAIDNSLAAEADWKVTSYVIGEADNTEIFGAYAFNFVDDGTILAVTRFKTTQGTWMTRRTNPDAFTIRFPSEDPLTRLTKEWHIIKRTATDIALENVSVKGEPVRVSFHRFQRQIEMNQLN